MNLEHAIQAGLVAIKWGRRVISASAARDGERLESLLGQSLKTTMELEMGSAIARDIALKKKRAAESSS